MEFHHVFSLDKNEMGCTNATKHVIKLTKSEPLRRVPADCSAVSRGS